MAPPGYETTGARQIKFNAAPLCAAVPSDGLGYTGSDVYFSTVSKRKGVGSLGGMTTKAYLFSVAGGPEG